MSGRVTGPVLILGATSDMARAVEAAYCGIYENMGEVCNAGSRLLVERSIYEEFVERFTAEGREAYVPGDPLDPATTMGPLVTKADQQRVLGMIEAGRAEGARLVFGGDAPEASMMFAKFSPDGSKLVSGGADGKLMLWDVSERVGLRTLRDRGEAVLVPWFLMRK